MAASEPVPAVYWLAPAVLLLLACAVGLGVATGYLGRVVPEQLMLIDLDRRVRPLKPAFARLLRLVVLLTPVALALAAAAAVLWARRVAGTVTPWLRAALAAPRRVWALGAAWVRQDPARAVTLTLVGLAGLAIRAGLILRPMSFDEAITVVYFASRGVLDALSDYAIPNNHILQTVLVNAIYRAGGTSPLLLRLPAFLAGMATIPLAYLVARRITNERAAVLAAGLVATAPPLVEYAAQARGYTLLTLLLLIALLAAQPLLERRRVAAWVVLVVASALGALTVPTMALGYAAVALWLLLASDGARRRQIGLELTLASMATGVLTAVLYMPAVFRSGVHALLANQYVQPLSLSQLPAALWGAVGDTAGCWAGALPRGSGLALAAVGVLPIVLWPRAQDRRLRALFAAALLATAALVAVQRVAPPSRVLLFFFPLAAIGVAVGVERGFGRLLGDGARVQWSWVGVTMLACLGWGAFRVAQGGLVYPGGPTSPPGFAGGGNACAEGYFLDAPRAAELLAPALTDPRSIAVAYEYSGMGEPLQFELLRRGVNPARVLRSRPKRGLAQVEGYSTVYVLARSYGASDGLPSGDPAPVLGANPAALHGTFHEAAVVARLRESEIFRLERRIPPVPPPGPGRISYPR